MLLTLENHAQNFARAFPGLRLCGPAVVIPTRAAEAHMSSRELGPVRSCCLRVLPRPRGSWIVATGRGNVLSEHATATEAEIAALDSLRADDEPLVFDR